MIIKTDKQLDLAKNPETATVLENKTNLRNGFKTIAARCLTDGVCLSCAGTSREDAFDTPSLVSRDR